MDRLAWPYVAPFLLFTIFLVAESWWPDQHYEIYPLKSLAVGALILWYARSLPSLRPSAAGLSVIIGVVGVVLWIILDRLLVHYPPPLVGRDPFTLYSPATAWMLFGFRVLGIAIVVPITEELFWRGFLMRILIQDDFTRVPLGTYRPFSFFVTTACFAAEHGSQWPLGLIVGLIYGTWFLRTKILGDVMLAHGVTNLLLSLYCLVTGDWHFLSIVGPAPK